jgi:hypothetical protein
LANGKSIPVLPISEKLFLNLEGLNDARTPLGARRVSAHRGWAGEKSGFFSILIKFVRRKDRVMWKFIAALALIAASFGLGFYFGQRPVGTLQQTASDLQHSFKDTSRNIFDTTMGIEKDLRRRQGLIDTKSRVVQAKSDLFDKNFGEAAKQLGEAAEALENVTKGAKQDEPILALRALTGTLREVKLELSMGKPVSMKKLDEIQREVDRQLNK